MAYAWDPNTRFAEGPSGYWIPVESGGRPLSDFVDVMNANGQGSFFIPKDLLPANWQPGMSLTQNPNGSFSAVPFGTNAVAPYDYWDYGTNTGTGLLGGNTGTTPTTPPATSPGSGGLPPSPTTGGSTGGLPTSPPSGTPPATAPGGGLPTSSPIGTPPSVPPQVGTANARDEIERLRLAGLLDNLHLNNPQGVRAPDYGNGPGVPMTHSPGAAAVYGYRQNNAFGTWDPVGLLGGSNPYYNAPSSGGGLIPPPMQGPIIIGPNGLPVSLL